MCSFFGYKVQRLQRVRIINLTLGELKPGQWRELRPDEVRRLLPDRPDFNF
jgi:23S rRNA pseudouridine2604 synthase